MRCPRCYFTNNKIEGEFPQLEEMDDGKHLKCPFCDYRILQDKYLSKHNKNENNKTEQI